MQKIPTIFVRDWQGTIGPPARFVLDEPHPDCGWVFAGEGLPTRKIDGTCCLIRGGHLYKRHEVRPGKPAPPHFEEVEHDDQTGKVIGWVPVGDGPEDAWHREAWERGGWHQADGTYELVGPKVQGNPERFTFHDLIPHSVQSLGMDAPPLDYDGMRAWLAGKDVEGVVWHHPDGRMAKIKLKDFGLKREAGVH